MSDNTAGLEMRVGILVVAGLLTTVLLILISDSVSFEGSYEVTAILEGAEGLHPGSPVKLDGLTIGEVASIVSYQDPLQRGSIKAIAVISKVHDIHAEAKLYRKTDGIFGDGHLAFSNPTQEDGTGRGPIELLPKDGSAKVVASAGFLDEATAQVGDIVAAVHELLDEDNRASFKRLLVASADTASEAKELVRDLQVRSRQMGLLAERGSTLLAGLEITRADLAGKAGEQVAQLNRTLTALREQVTAVGQASVGLAQTAGGALKRADALMLDGDRLLEAMQPDLIGIGQQARQLAQALAAVARDLRDGRGVLGQLVVNEAMAKDLNDLLITGEQFAERVADNPQLLVWGTSGAESDLARDHRDQTKIRRAFHEGFDRNPPLELGRSPRLDGQAETTTAPPPMIERPTPEPEP